MLVLVMGVGGGMDLERFEQTGGRGRDLLDRGVERSRVAGGRGPEAADLPHVLERGGPHVLVGDVLGVRGPQGLDASAHNGSLTPGHKILPTRARTYREAPR